MGLKRGRNRPRPVAADSPKIASTEARLIPFSHLYHATMRNHTLQLEQERQPEAKHDYHHQVSIVVIFAALVTEAAINEIAYWLRAHLATPIAIPSDFERYSIRRKWHTVPRLSGAAGFDVKVRPWLDFDALIELRNALVHAGAYPSARTEVLTLLEARGCVQPAMDWFESAMTLRTARWACATASAMPQTLQQMLAPNIDLHNGGFSWIWGNEWLPTIDTPPP